ncbi:MAG: helix-hairpin-helix domain-containing protein [Gemmatimonadota bacterium]
MDKAVAALVLEEIADLLALQDAEPFRVRAYRTAAAAVDRIRGDLPARLAAGELDRVPGLGPATLGVLRELVETGRSRLYDRLRAETPAGLAQLRAVAGLGPKRVRTLHEKLGIETLEALREAADAGKIRQLEGFGPATERRILHGIAFVDRSTGRRRQPEAYATADRLIAHFETLEVDRVRLAGELRRRRETVDGIDLLVSASAVGPVVEAFMALPALTRLVRVDDQRARAIMADGAAIRLRCVPPERWAAAGVAETGSEGHVAALAARAERLGLRLTDAALLRGDEALELDDEVELYAALELPWIPPELREGRGEVAAAAEGRLPRLVDIDDLRGTFHCHTTWSDGRATVAEMAEAALARGWRYLGIADHSVSASYAGGLTMEEVRAQQREIDAWNASRGGELRLFKGIESDIRRDGRLDYPDDVLDSFDYVVGSVHSGFRMDRETMTRRITTAMADPHLTILGHPTGRLLLSREPYAVDLDAVIAAAAGAGAAIEINGDPHRLDMDWRHWPDARSRGVKCAIDPDAHSIAGLGAVGWGVAMARKGGLEPEDVINTWELERVESYLGV